MDKKDWYFRQKVTEAELDSAFESVETAIDRLYEDLGIIGIIYGATVNQHSPTPDLTVDIPAGIVIQQSGQRIKWAALQNLDCSIDENSTPTAVGTPGNSKYLSIFAEFLRVQSDPRIDGNRDTIYFEQTEGYQLNVVQGAEAGSPTRPSLRSDQILLADILITFGHTQIVTGDISNTRREWAVTASSASVTIERNTIEDALQDLADAIATSDTALSDHIASSSNEHLASAVNYAGGSAWHDGTTNPAATVEAQLDKIVTDLVNNAGSDRIGSAAQIQGSQSVTVGSIYDQIGEILSLIDSQQKGAQKTRAQNMFVQQDIFTAGYSVKSIAADDDSIFVAVGDDGSNVEIRTSKDGVIDTWTSRSASGTPDTFNVVTWDSENSLFVIGGRNGALTGAEIQTSSDGITWTARTPTGMLSAGDVINDIVRDTDNNYTIAVGGDGSNGGIIRSANDTTWAAATSFPSAADFTGVAQNDLGTAVAVGATSGGGPNAIYSTDGGDTWTTCTGISGSGTLHDVIFDDESAKFIAVGENGQVWSSSNGISWTSIKPTGISDSLKAVVSDELGLILIFGSGVSPIPIYMTTDNGSNWKKFFGGTESVQIGASNRSAEFIHGRFFMCGVTTRHLFYTLMFDGIFDA